MKRRHYIEFFFISKNSGVGRRIAVSRLVLSGLLVGCTGIAALGYSLLLSGSWREDAQQALLRKKLARENFELTQRIISLRRREQLQHRRYRDIEREERRTLDVSIYPEEPDAVSFSKNPSRLGAAYRTREMLRRARAAQRKMAAGIAVLEGNPELAESVPSTRPVKPASRILRGFSMELDPFTNRKVLHPAVDFSGEPGDPVYASGGGVVKGTGENPFYGKWIRITHSPSIETFYAHLESVEVSTGHRVFRGTPIGVLGKSGMATGPHLHFEITVRGVKVDPAPLYASAPAQWAPADL